MRLWIAVFSLLCFLSCKKAETTSEDKLNVTQVPIDYADGFSILEYDGFSKVIVHSPWQDAQEEIEYLLLNKEEPIPEEVSYDEIIELPIKKLVTTSTTHIPSLITLNKINSLVGFPNLDYISSKEARQLIDQGKLKELGTNESLNTEILLSVNPDVVFSFAIEGQNKVLNQIQKSGIPVVYNGDWLEKDVLGKAEWIKFFGAFLGELEAAQKAFKKVEEDYLRLKAIAKKQDHKPSVISGAMYQDRWYLPYGSSWQAQLFEDAHADYIYKNTKGKGSAAFSFEKVLQDAKEADFWISPGSFISYAQMEDSNAHYTEFDAFQKQKIYTMSLTTGETGGVLFYELGPNRPDLILKDLIKIFHPELLQQEGFTFFKPLALE
ncbi:ABC transporter substrate-binding protein [Psychroflexus tropicus]|uniref:ABC transporter substrate-binding protein n=1 Tax=Psychroflexus tropicus TaxID=197345 RepID=UPI00037536F4|nr:ABC transporter substrate-binding protein [Psychroflexus tropicus]